MMIVIFMLMLALRATSPMCSKDVKRGPYVLGAILNDLPRHDRHTYNFKRFSVINHTSHVIFASLEKQESYCYNGGFASNSYCKTERKQLNITYEMEKIWLEKGGCCVPNKMSIMDGSGANDMQERGGRKHSNERCGKHFEIEDTETSEFAYHTYLDSWGCSYMEHETPVMLTCSSPIDCFNSPRLEVSLNGIGVIAHDDKPIKKGNTWIFFNGKPQITSKVVELPCFNITGSGMVCYDEEAQVFMENGDCINGHCYFKGIVRDANSVTTAKESMMKASVDKNLIEIVEHIEYLSQTSNFNEYVLNVKLNKVIETLLLMIQSMAKIDERLIGNLIGKPMKTSFTNEKVFESYPCPLIEEELHASNCKDNKFFSNGRWTEKKDSDVCVTYNNVETITLFDGPVLLEIPVVHDDLEKRDNDWDSWEFYANSMFDLKTTMRGTRNGGLGTGLEHFVSMSSSWASALSAFSLIGGLGASVGLPLIVMFVCICFIRR